MGKTFERIRLCSVGKFESADKIPQWVRANGGEYTRDVNSRTTHLITTKEAYKQNVELVKAAKALKTVKIVSFDWLEESLLSKTRRPLKETPFLWENLLNPVMKDAPVRTAPVSIQPKRLWDPFAPRKGARKAKGVNRGHPYQEPDNGDIWKATIVRTCNPPRNRERYQLAIIESLSTRPTYSTYAKYSKTGSKKIELLSPPDKDLSIAMKVFLEFFKEKTGKEWSDRGNGKLPPPKCNEEGKPLPAHEGWYTVEIHENIFTDYLKSYQEPEAVPEPEIQVQVGSSKEQNADGSSCAVQGGADLDGYCEELNQNNALLASLLSMGAGISTSNQSKEEDAA